MSRVREDFEPAVLARPPSCLRPAAVVGTAASRRRPAAERNPLTRHRFDALDRPAGRPGLDVICAGMYRACSTWQYEVVGHLVEHKLEGQRLGYVRSESYAGIDRPATERTNRGARIPWRVLKSHEGSRAFSRALESGRAVAVYVYRDLREVIFSLIHKRGTTFRQLLRQGMIHQILANDRFWTSQPRVLVQRYEDLVADPTTGVVQLARHLGLAVARREAAEIALEYSLASNRSRIEHLRRRLLAAGVDLDDPANLQICDPTTLLHWNHLRPARAGSWEAEATPAQRDLIRSLCDRWLLGHDYPPTGMPSPPIRGGQPDDGPYTRDSAIGRLVRLARSACGQCPRVTRRFRQLLGIPNRNEGAMVSWPEETTG